MEFLRDYINKSSHSQKRESLVSSQILDTITNLKLEFTRQEYQVSLENGKDHKEIMNLKKEMILKIDSKIDEWKDILDRLIPRLFEIKSREFRSNDCKEFKIKDSNDIIAYISNVEKDSINSLS